MIFDCVSLSLEISSLVIFCVILIIIGVAFCILKRKRKFMDFTINAVDVGLSPNLSLSLNNSDRQIAYKVWIDIQTRTIAVKIDLDKDNIKVVNDSYHACFVTTRELIKDISVSKLEKNRELVNLLTKFLNNLLRPYLTKWGVLYSDWYELEQKNNEEASRVDKSKYKTFIEIQRAFPLYEELTADLLRVNKKVSSFTKELEKIAFNTK